MQGQSTGYGEYKKLKSFLIVTHSPLTYILHRLSFFSMENKNEKQPDIRIILGKRIQSLRKAKEISQEKLAGLSGLDRTYIAGIESGKRNPTITSLQKISSGLNTCLFSIFDSNEFKS